MLRVENTRLKNVETQFFYARVRERAAVPFYPASHTYSFLLLFPLYLTSFVTAELCALSEYRIYPGNGKLFIRRDGKPIMFGTSKAFSLTMQRKKPAKLVWTQAWRRLNKKGATDAVIKKRARRTNKVARAVVGLSLDDIRKRATQKSEVRSAQRDAALKEVKARKAANKSKSGKKSVQGAGQVNKVPKNVKRAQKGGTQR